MSDHPFWYTSIRAMMSKLSKSKAKKLTKSSAILLKRLFEQLGGSWEDLSKGSSAQWAILRRCCKAGIRVLD